MFDEKNRYIIKEYQTKPTFSGFLPGIAGPMGVPAWCYYNNRGQAVCSFGARDKDHSIMDFSPAYCAYRDVSSRGFRTFCKVNGEYKELFTANPDMHIGAAELEIIEKSGELEAHALYFGLPGEPAAALVRVLTIKNTSNNPVTLEILDGMPELVPYGVNQDALKNMTQLATAWMRSEKGENGLTYYCVRASMADTAQVTEIKGTNFCISIDEKGIPLAPIADQSIIFGTDTSFGTPKVFIQTSLEELQGKEQITENSFPCCFVPKIAAVASGDEIKIYSLYGQTESKEAAKALAKKVQGNWFEEKYNEAVKLVDNLTTAVSAKTADPVFDGYCRQTYLDNLLRGGVPYFFENEGKRVPFYLYSRKHGDPERDYNYFSLGGEYFAQGNGNFRDINQNRRCDVLFSPEIGDRNIRTFYQLIQPDGYNPLVLTAETYTLPEKDLAKISEKTESKISPENQTALKELLSKSFTPGALAMAAEEWGLSKDEAVHLTAEVVCLSHNEPNAVFSEGYWCDHWTYNLDLIESYLSVYPENEQKLIFGDADYKWFAPHALVNPRVKRYRMTENGLRQYNALTEQTTGNKWVCTAKGEAAQSALIEKLLLLCAIKTATLDAAGMGIEMEGGKPGWYDALNGLPGLLGSSIAETCELLRLVRFTANALKSHGSDIELYIEIAELISKTAKILDETEDTYTRWDKLNLLKENYREKTVKGFDGSRTTLTLADLESALNTMEKAIQKGIEAAIGFGNGVIPTYFTFEAEGIIDTPDGPMPKKLIPKPLPLFLEGPVHYLKLSLSTEEKRTVADKIKNSGLYDKELSMYKVNESLKEVTFEAGRTKAFTPGWLENESIWLHMEYKYLLELLRSGMYSEFSEAFKTAAVPFMNPDRYGRSPLENVSFLVSSANADRSKWGRGFVARLSGSTAEFLEMWQLMFFGKKPFRDTEKGLTLKFTPFIPDYLIPENGEVNTTFLGNISVTYKITGNRSHEVEFEPQQWTLTLADGTTRVISDNSLSDTEAHAVRAGQIKSMEIILK